MIEENEVSKLNNDKLLELLEKSSKDSNKTIELLLELNKRIEDSTFSFDEKHKEYIFTYMLLSNKYKLTESLNKLINDIDFIKLLDKTNIDSSMIPSLTSNCSKPRLKLIMNSKKIKEAILDSETLLTTEDIIADFTKKEIEVLREDIRIDNHLINSGISFDTLKDETVDILLEDPSVFNIYKIETIVEFANNYKDQTYLANKKDFMNIYISKLTNEYHYENKLFNVLTINQVKNIIEEFPDDKVLLHLFKDTKNKTHEYLLKNDRVEKLINESNEFNILNILPVINKKRILINRDNIFKGVNFKLLNTLSKKDITEVINSNNNTLEEIINLINTNSVENTSFYIGLLTKDKIEYIINRPEISNNIDSYILIANANSEIIKKAIFNNTSILNNSTNKVLKLLDASKFNINDRIKLTTMLTNHNLIDAIMATIPYTERKDIYHNKKATELLITSNNFEVDNYSLKYLLDNIDLLAKVNENTLIDVLINCNIDYAKQALDIKVNLDKILKAISKNPKEVAQVLNEKIELVPYFQKELKYITPSFVKCLDYPVKKELINDEVLMHLLKDNNNAKKVYDILSSQNTYLLNTLDFSFINLDILNVKSNILLGLIKYPEIEENIVLINNKIKIDNNFINTLYFYTQNLNIKTVSNMLEILKDSVVGNNRKIYGNIPKMLTEANKEKLTKSDLNKLFDYLLYKSNRFDVAKPSIIKTPMNYFELMSYDKQYMVESTNRIKVSNTNILEYFVNKHFKLSIAEAKVMQQKYNINRVDSSIYKREYNFLDNLNKILNTDSQELKDMDKTYPIYSIKESFEIENEIIKMYGKVYNYEIKSKTYSSKPIYKELYGKEIKIFDCPKDFMLLISNISIDEEFSKTNSYYEAWHNTVNKIDYINCSLIANDNFTLKDDIAFGFNGMSEESIIAMSPNKKITPANEEFLMPRQLIDNTRDQNNTININKYNLKTTKVVSNNPNIEPDFIIVDKEKLKDNGYLEQIYRASQEFKSKTNRDGIAIIAVDKNKIIKSELGKITKLINEYNKGNDMQVLAALLSKVENNYYSNLSNKAFDIETVLNIVRNRINKSNSIIELDYIEDIFINEYNKFKNVSSTIKCNFNIREIKSLINQRKLIINI